MNNWFYIITILSINGVICAPELYTTYLPVLGTYKSYSGYTDNHAYIKELDHIVNFRVSRLKTTIIEITRNLYDARNYDLQSLSQEVNIKFNDFINKLLANYSVITSMGYHFEILLYEYKKATLKLTKKFIPQKDDNLSDDTTRALTYFTVKKLDMLFASIIKLADELNNEWDRLKIYVTRGVSEMEHQSTPTIIFNDNNNTINKL